MKIVVVLLLMVPATAAINEWLGLPEGKFQQLDQLLDGMYRILFIVIISFFFLCSPNRFVNDVSRLTKVRLSLTLDQSRNVHDYLQCKVILAISTF